MVCKLKTKRFMKKVIIVSCSLLLFISACNEEYSAEKKKETTEFSDITKNLAGSKEAAEEKYSFLKKNVVIILAEELKSDSTHIKVQDYIDDKGSFIPVFTSQEKYKESTQGQQLGKGTIEINGMFMLSIMKVGDRIRLNPGLKDETYFSAKELKEKFKAEIDVVQSKMIKN